MKKILIATNVITLAAVVYLLVTANRPSVKPPGPGDLPTATAPDCNLRKDYSNDEVPGLIKISFAQMISEAYARDSGKKYVTINDSITDIEDARCLRFGIEKLKKYIWHIEQRFCGKNCKTLQLGIRFYYAIYPDTAACVSNGVNPQYAMKHTLFMVPTYFDGRRHVDFDPFYPGDDTCKPMPLAQLIKTKEYETYLTKNKGRSSVVAMFADYDGDVDNHGGMRPPPPGSGTFLAQSGF